MLIFEVLAMIAALIGGAVLIFFAIPSFDSAPAMAALAAIAIGIAVIPYCFVSLLQRREVRMQIDRMKERMHRIDGE